MQIELLKLDKAEHALQADMKLDPESATDGTHHLGHVLREQRDGWKSPPAAYERALALDPDKLQAFLAPALCCTRGSASDRDHVVAARQRSPSRTEAFERRGGAFRTDAIRSYILTQLQGGNFYLAYQGMNDRQLRSEYAAFVADFLSAAAPTYLSHFPRIINPHMNAA